MKIIFGVVATATVYIINHTDLIRDGCPEERVSVTVLLVTDWLPGTV